MRMNFSVPVIALMAGTALGYFLAPEKAATPEAQTAHTTKAAISDVGDKASENALRARIKELEQQLAEKVSSEPVATTEAKEVVAENRPREFNPREMMEKMKQEDPERYAQMTNRFARFRARRAEQVQSRMDFLASIDTSFMSEKAKTTHAQLQSAIVKREALEDQIHSDEITEDERRELFDQMREMDHEMRELNRRERDNLLEETAIELGYQGDDAADIVATIKDIFEATGGERQMGPPGPPPRD